MEFGFGPALTLPLEKATRKIITVNDLFWVFDFPVCSISEEFVEKIGSITMDEFFNLEVPVAVMMRLTVIIYGIQKKMNIITQKFFTIPQQFHDVFRSEFSDSIVEATIGKILQTHDYCEKYLKKGCRLGDMVTMGRFNLSATLKEHVEKCGFPMVEIFSLLHTISTLVTNEIELDLPVWVHAVVLFIPLITFSKDNVGRHLLVLWKENSKKIETSEFPESWLTQRRNILNRIFHGMLKKNDQAASMVSEATAPYSRQNNLSAGDLIHLQLAYANSMQYILTYPKDIPKTGHFCAEELVARMMVAMIRVGQSAWSHEGQEYLHTLRTTLHDARANILLIEQLLQS